MAAGYRIFALWLARAQVKLRVVSGERIAIITRFYRPVANIINFN